MAPPVFFVDPGTEPDADGAIHVTGAEAHHAAQVMRMRAGEPVQFVDGEGRRLEGTVSSVSKDGLVASVERVTCEPEPAPRIIVIQALAKGDRGEQAVASMTEVGVDVIVPWSADHCVARWSGERARKGVEKWRMAARAATKQARRSRLPRVEALHATEELAPWITQAAVAICLDESASDAVTDLDIPDMGDVVLIVGPEGGLSDAERRRLTELGARAGRLGPTVMRTSTAGPVAAGVVLSRTSRWGAP